MASSPGFVTEADNSADSVVKWVSMVEQSVSVKTDIKACFVRLKRMARYRLITPLQRSRHPPGYVARGVAVGLFWAMTPTIGIQMPMVLLHWLIVRKVDRWDFNLIHAWAWTWVTNFATMFPVYYAFYVTGQMFLGNWDDLTGYQGFVQLWDVSANETAVRASPDGFLEHLWFSLAGLFDFASIYFVIVVKHWGLPMLVGCVPYAILSAWFGYFWSMRIVVSHRRSILERRLHRHEKRLAAQSRRKH